MIFGIADSCHHIRILGSWLIVIGYLGVQTERDQLSSLPRINCGILPFKINFRDNDIINHRNFSLDKTD